MHDRNAFSSVFERTNRNIPYIIQSRTSSLIITHHLLIARDMMYSVVIVVIVVSLDDMARERHCNAGSCVHVVRSIQEIYFAFIVP
jgi:predicted metallo-beta-lactamase superfamily hydrolase